MTSLHEVKIKTMCRICTNFIPKESKTYSKESIEKIIKIIYKDKEISDFSYDGPASHSNVLCGACHQKFHRLIKKLRCPRRNLTTRYKLSSSIF